MACTLLAGHVYLERTLRLSFLANVELAAAHQRLHQARPCRPPPPGAAAPPRPVSLRQAHGEALAIARELKGTYQKMTQAPPRSPCPLRR